MKKKKYLKDLCKIAKVPSVTEGAETLSWVSEALQKEMLDDLEADSDGVLKNADIDVSSMKLVANRVLLRDKIKRALNHWDELSDRIPLRKQRPTGIARGLVGGVEDMVEDFNINEHDLPLEPPDRSDPSTNDLDVYRYHVQRLFCAVPRMASLRGRMAEGSVPLKTVQVKRLLEANPKKRPFGDAHLPKEINYASEPKLADETVHSTASNNPAAATAPKSSVGGTIAASGGSGDVERHVGRILPSFSRPSRAVVTFALYSTTVREDAADSPSSCSLVGPSKERRIYEVEALEHNTLQQVMEVMPSCLADRASDMERRKMSWSLVGRSTENKGRDRLSLGGGFIFLRGVFYMTKPNPGEDMREVLPPPPPNVTVKTLRAKIKESRVLLKEHMNLQESREKALAQKQERLLRKKSRQKGPETADLNDVRDNDPDVTVQTQDGSHASTRPSFAHPPTNPSQEFEIPSRTGEREIHATSPAIDTSNVSNSLPWTSLSRILLIREVEDSRSSPPHPWIKRWLEIGGKYWSTRKSELLEDAEKFKRAEELNAAAEEALLTSAASRSGNVASAQDEEVELEAKAVAAAGAAFWAATEAVQSLFARRTDRVGNLTREARGALKKEDRKIAAEARGRGERGRGSGLPRERGRGVGGRGGGVIPDKRKRGGDESEASSNEPGGCVDDSKTASSSSSRNNGPGGERGEDGWSPRAPAARGRREGASVRKKGKGNGSRTTSDERELEDNGEGRTPASLQRMKRAEAMPQARPTVNATQARGKGKGKAPREAKKIKEGTASGGKQESDGGRNREDNNEEERGATSNDSSAAWAGLEEVLAAGQAQVGGGREAAGPGAAGGDAGLKHTATERPYNKLGSTTVERCNQGSMTKHKLGMGDSGGDVVWASDITVGELRPVVGERYMFVHHCDCSHIFLVSDIRLEPTPATLPSPSAEPSGVPAAGPRADGSSNRVAPNHGDVGRPDAGRVSRSGVEGEGTRTGPAARRDNRKKYPRLSFRIVSDAKRCGVCKTMAADVKSYGHPLSDQVPIIACNECIDMLFYDEKQKPLTGEMAGEEPPAVPLGAENSTVSPSRETPPTSSESSAAAMTSALVDEPLLRLEGVERGREGEEGGRRPKGWKLYQRVFSS